VPESPDIIVFAGGINHYGTYTASQVGTDALTLFQQSAAAFPLAQQFVVAPFWKAGVRNFQTNLRATRDAMRTAA
jgi:hypothetical protein